MRLKLVKEKCIGCGICYALLPQLFQFTAGKPIEFREEFRESDNVTTNLNGKINRDLVMRCVKSCPTRALILIEDS